MVASLLAWMLPGAIAGSLLLLFVIVLELQAIGRQLAIIARAANRDN